MVFLPWVDPFGYPRTEIPFCTWAVSAMGHITYGHRELCLGASSHELQTHALNCYGNAFHGGKLRAGWQWVDGCRAGGIGIIYFADGPDVFL